MTKDGRDGPYPIWLRRIEAATGRGWCEKGLTAENAERAEKIKKSGFPPVRPGSGQALRGNDSER